MKRVVLAFALLLPACFSVDERPCSFACGPNGECPDDYQCRPDGYCHLHGDTSACGFSDLAVPDLAAIVDANVDLAIGQDGPDLAPETADAGASIGSACTASADCASGHCVDDVCCSTACTGACVACSSALTGGSNGTCATVLDNLADPRHVCVTTLSSSCGTDGKCVAGACRFWPSPTVCGAPSCSGSTLTPASTCNGSGTCAPGTPGPCPASLICANATSCKTACGGDGDCTSGFCTNPGASGNCGALLSPGVACSGNNQCASGICGASGSGRCCSASCTTGGACGATDCDAGGACVYPTATTACGASASCSGSTLTPGGTCNSAGGCTAGTAGPCPSGLKCASASACKTFCTIDGDCASATSYCANPGASGTCLPKGGAGAVCGGNNQCTSGICGVAGSGNCCSASCTTGGACGATGCNGSGACVYPTSTTSCGSASCSGGTLTPAGTCNSAGGCTAGTAGPCAGGFICASATACKTACGSDNDCVSPSVNFCSNPGASGTCVAKGGAGTPCGGNNQCTSNVCGVAGSGNCCTAACTGGACGATGCNGSGACVYPTGSTSCGAGASCSGSTLTPAGACNGSGGCTPGTPGPCPANLICANATSCKTACGGDGDCASGFCSNPGASGTCGALLSPGTPCSGNNQCTSNVCGIAGSGNCCTAACTTGGTCGATGCNGSGACVYPTGTTSCGSASCSGSTLTPAGACNSAGGCTPGTPGACAGGFICASATTCKTACASDNDCASPSTNFCFNPGPSGVCVGKLGAGSGCGGNNQCTSGVCGIAGSGNCCSAACTTGGTCGATGCNGSGACVYPTSATPCGASAMCSGSTLTPAGACNSAGGCTPGTPGACPGGFNCASSTSCLTTCGNDNDCASPSTNYCANPGVSGTCVGKGGNGAACSANDQCTNNLCCTTPPPNVCANADTLTVFSNLNACSSPPGTCSYPSAPQTCANGCSNGACNGAPSFAADATATSPGGAVVLDKEANLNASNGTAPANAVVNVTVTTTPNNGYQSLTLDWTNNNFASTTPVTMTLSSQTGGVDTWTAQIPAQAVGTTVRFFLDALRWDGSTHDFNPGSFVNYTYVTVALAINFTGGVGTVTSTPAALNCSTGNTGTCSAPFANGSTVQLNTSAGFKSWGAGPCSGAPTTTPCSFTFTSSTTQNVAFFSALSIASGGNAQAPANAALDPVSITVEAWSKATMAIPPNGRHVALISKGSPTTGANGYQLGYFSNGASLFPEIVIVATAPGNIVASVSCRSPSAAGAGTHHIAGEYDQTAGFVELFVDGAFVCFAQFPGGQDGGFGGNVPLKAATGSPLIFGPPSGDPSPFGGVLDEPRISNAAIYGGGFTPARHPTAIASTVGLWHFDEGTGTTAADSSATNDAATLSASNASFAAEP